MAENWSKCSKCRCSTPRDAAGGCLFCVASADLTFDADKTDLKQSDSTGELVRSGLKLGIFGLFFGGG